MNLFIMQLSNIPYILELKWNACHTKIVSSLFSIQSNTQVFITYVFPLKFIQCYDLLYACSSILSLLLSITWHTWIKWSLFIQKLCISRSCLMSYKDYIDITCMHEHDKGMKEFNYFESKKQPKACFLLISYYLSFLCLTYVYKTYLFICFLFSSQKTSRTYVLCLYGFMVRYSEKK